MEKYKDMTYTVRKDGRLYKKIEKNKQKYHLYDTNKEGLYKQYVDLKYKLENDLCTNKNEILFKDYAQKWFDLNISSKSNGTQVSVKNRIRHMNKYIGNMKLKNIKPDDIKLITTSMKKEGLLDVVNRTSMDCKRIFQSAIDNDITGKNPCINIDKVKYQKEERIPLKINEDKKVLDAALNHKYGTFILIIRYCGLRPEECVALDIDSFDEEKHVFHINTAAEFVHNQPHLKETKNKKTRDVPIPDIIFNEVKEKVDLQKEIGSNFIFTKETDKFSMWTKTALKVHLKTFLNYLNRDILIQQQILKKELKKTTEDKKSIKEKIDKLDKEKIKFTYYILRHSFCTMLYYAGINIKEAQRIMGHSSAKMVYDIYAHLDSERENSEERINTYISEIYQ